MLRRCLHQTVPLRSGMTRIKVVNRLGGRRNLFSEVVRARKPRGRLFGRLCLAASPVLLAPSDLLGNAPLGQIRTYNKEPKAKTHTIVRGNIFSRCFRWLQMFFRTITLSALGGMVITSGLLVYWVPFVPNFARRYWKNILVSLLGNGGATTTKLGQWAATRPDLFPESICISLCNLHTKAPFHKYKYTKTILEDFYECDVEKAFENFDMEPIASGAIAQVYKGSILENGEEKHVAIKVRHPHVVSNIELDLQILRVFGVMLEYIPGLKWMSVRTNIECFAASMESQLDLINEGRNLEQFQENFRKYPNICFPTPYLALSSENILVESFEEGIQVSEYFKQGMFDSATRAYKQNLASLGFNSFLKMVFVDNFIHGDLHPGNILVRPSQTKGGRPQIVFLDAGLVVSLSGRDKSNFIDLFSSVAAGNGKRGAALMIERSGAAIPTIELQEKFKTEMEILFTEVTSKPLREVPIGAAFFNVMKICRECKVQIDGNFCSLITGLIVVEGLAKALNADFDLMKEARPLLRTDTEFVSTYLRNRL